MSPPLRSSSVWLWILALASLSVGARNFELGLSMDAPLYATIARGIARQGHWFLLSSNIPEFQPFAEHPHFGFWVLAAVFRLLPIADWSARVAGHLYYVGFLAMFFFAVRSYASQRVAVLGVVLLWSWYLFSNIFSSALLDPGVLFFGSASIFLWESASRRRQTWRAAGAGALLAIAGLYKGLTIAGFLPAWALVFAWSLRGGKGILPTCGRLAAAVMAFVAVALIYFAAVRASEVSNFFEMYWANQVTHRFARQWSIWGLLNREYWGKILQYTNFLAPLGLAALWRRRGRGLPVALPLVLALSFIFLFATNGLRGGQYEVMVLPWLAWLIADGIDSLTLRRLPLDRLVPITTVLALGGVLVAQYLPIRTHSQGPLPEHHEVRALARHYQIDTIYQDEPIGEMPFFWASQMAWYGEVKMEGYVHDSVPPATPHRLFFQTVDKAATTAGLQARGWCRGPHFTHGTLWLPCGLPAADISDWRYRWD